MPENKTVNEEIKTDNETEKETEKPEGENLEEQKTDNVQAESDS